uniref:Uncharacterized protein n=1 Tax=Physcomitrium patens TaxID=3218 RepID=A0A2K1JLP8_PHYPA|nr:hypothetical protein PHYPA_017302 [Physcomitrium patens]
MLLPGKRQEDLSDENLSQGTMLARCQVATGDHAQDNEEIILLD